MQTSSVHTYSPELLKGATWGQPNKTVEHLETHAAHVFLCGNRAYKIKKSVTLPYLDFSTCEKRRAVLEREMEVNRTWAPDLYLGISEIEGEPVLVMRRFDQSALLKEIVKGGPLPKSIVTALATTVTAAHATAVPIVADGDQIMRGLFNQLHKAFQDSPEIFPSDKVVEFESKYLSNLERCSQLLLTRSRQGLVKRCHADLHCGNIIIENDAPVLFDALEFSEKLGTIDVLYDLAFLLMDLMRFNQRSAACQLLNDYLDLRRRDEDLSGLIAMPMFMATRAGVRALVAADLAHELPVDNRAAKECEARSYFDECLLYLQPAKPKLICIGGLSGTGKSSLAMRLAPFVDPAPGAILIRSDVERKRLSGVGLTERLPEAAYKAETTQQVYHTMFSRAEAALKAGFSVTLDAVFLLESQRREIADIATRLSVLFTGLWLEADDAVKMQRISNRVGDASDATVSVLEKQCSIDIGQISWLRLDAGGTVQQTLEQARAAL
jgi:uncharacterized protein